MSVLDLLLETDVEKLQANQSNDFEVKRLSKVLGERFIVTCRPLTTEQILHIAEVSKNEADTKLYAVLEACRIEGKKFNNKDLMDKFKAMTPIDLLNKLFLPGEIYKLYNFINELSGYSRDAVKEIKN
nr:phage portal protein [uncultured Cellulosilyticum sp.]